MKISYYSPSDDWEFWYVDGEEVIVGNHDDYGWSGMEAIKDTFEMFAEKLGIEIEYLEDFPE